MKHAKEAEKLFYSALDLDPAAREIWLVEACQGDEALLAEVRSLLVADQHSGSFLDGNLVGPLMGVLGEADPLLGQEIGGFELKELIGRGGSGRVYRGERIIEESVQSAAVKILSAAYDEDGLRRFRNECRALSQLQHPHIARLIDGGIAASGSPFIVMELVDGLTIDLYCDQKNLSLEARIDLFRQACDAVHHAHQHSTIHRDLKPQNILVTEDGQVKLVDFGIARALNSAEEVTRTGLQMLTPDFASPEQLRGELLSTATDIYSLGVVLYRLLTDDMPYRLGDGGLAKLMESHSTTIPRRPSEVSPNFRRRLRGDLDTIVLKALREDSQRRYLSAAALSEDLHRYLRGRPVEAQPDTFRYRAGKFISRNRLGVTAAAAGFVLLLASGGAVFHQWQIAEEERAWALENEAAANSVAKFMADLFLEASPRETGGELISALEMVERGAENAGEDLSLDPHSRARVLAAVGQVYGTLAEYEKATGFLEQAVEIERGLGDRPRLSRAWSLRYLGDVLTYKGEHIRAHEIFSEALREMEALYGPKDPKIASYINRITIYDRTLLYSEKVERFRYSLGIVEELEGRGSRGTGAYLLNLGWAQDLAGYPQDAWETYERMLEIFHREYGPEGLWTVTASGNAATVLNNLGRFAAAESLLIVPLRSLLKLYEGNSVVYSTALFERGRARLGQGQVELAEADFQACLDMFTRIGIEEHPEAAYSHGQMALILSDRGEFEAATGHAARAVELLEAEYGADAVELAIGLMVAGKVAAAQGDLVGAEDVLDRALSIRQIRLRQKHPLSLETETELGRIRALMNSR